MTNWLAPFVDLEVGLGDEFIHRAAAIGEALLGFQIVGLSPRVGCAVPR